MTRAIALLSTAAVLLAAPAWGDHPGPFRSEGMSPLTTALLTGGLAFAVALIVVLVVVVLTKKPPESGERDAE